MKLPIYLDHHATTPVDPRVLEVMLPYFTEVYGNASSVDHEMGAAAQSAVERARKQVADAIGAQPSEIVFTSGATESNNLAILGTAEALADKGNHVITCATEHPAVLDPCQALERRGWQVTVLPVDSQGLIDPNAVRRAITPGTVLVSVMAANNEIGTIAPIAEIGRIAKEHDVLFHTDATQAVGKLQLDVRALDVDLLSLSGHKIYGPKGVGALYVRRRKPRVHLKAQLHGGGHERGLRSGTLNVAGIVGLGAAIDVAVREMTAEVPRVKALRDQFLSSLSERVGGIQLNGHPAARIPNNLNITIDRVEAKALLVAVNREICFSAGSACATTKVEPSHVLLAIGLTATRVFRSVRFSLGRMTSQAEIDFAVVRVAEAVSSLRKIAST